MQALDVRTREGGAVHEASCNLVRGLIRIKQVTNQGRSEGKDRGRKGGEARDIGGWGGTGSERASRPYLGRQREKRRVRQEKKLD